MSTNNPLIARHDEEATSPEAALRLWFEAIFAHLDPSHAHHAEAMEAIGHMTIPFKKDGQGWARRPSNLTFVGRLSSQPHIFYSYAAGSTPDNGYPPPGDDFELDVVKSQRDPYGKGWAVALRSSGADSPRLVYLKQSTRSGLWFVDNHHNVYVGVKPPAADEEFV